MSRVERTIALACATAGLVVALALSRPALSVEGGVGLTMNGLKTSMMGFLTPEKGACFRNDVYRS